MGTLGSLGAIPGWPGADAFPPQPMVAQIRAVLTEYEARGGRVQMTIYEGSGHFPPLDARERWARSSSASWSARDPRPVRRRPRARGPARPREPGRRAITVFAREVADPDGRDKPWLRLPAGRAGPRVAAADRQPARPRLARPRARRTSACCCSTSAARAARRRSRAASAPSTSRTSAPTASCATAERAAHRARLGAVERARPELRRARAPHLPLVRARRPARGADHRRRARHRRAASTRSTAPPGSASTSAAAATTRAIRRTASGCSRCSRPTASARPHPRRWATGSGMSDGFERAALRPRAAARLAGVPRRRATTRSSSSATRSTGCCTRPAGPTASRRTGRRSGPGRRCRRSTSRPSTSCRGCSRARCADTAEALAQHEWPRLYDQDVLASNKVPIAATIYTEDLYVERAFAEQTAAAVPELPRLDHQRVRPQRAARRRRAHPRPPDRSGPWPRLTCATGSPSSRRSTRRCCAELRAFDADYLRRSA